MSEKALTVVPEEQSEITLSEKDVKKFIAPNATDKELYMFMNIARSYGLNPFKREIHFVKYGDKPGSVIVGYETYLKRAERTGQLDGWSVKILDKGEKTERAEITIHRKDQKSPFVWEVFRSEFDKQQSTWKAMPQFMLKKVAIAQGFRLAFPVEMGGMPYIPEEISANNSESLNSPEPEIVEPPNGDPPAEPEFTPKTNSRHIDKLNRTQKAKVEWLCNQKAITDGEANQLLNFYLGGYEPTKESIQKFIEGFDEVFETYMDSLKKKEKEVC